MNGKVEEKQSTLDALKWLVVVVLIAAGVVANFYYAGQPIALRLAGWLVLACITLFIAGQTARGQSFWNFAKESRVELRKVVWPTRQETIQTTFVVILMVVVTALFLWGVDSVLLWLVSLLTSQKG